MVGTLHVGLALLSLLIGALACYQVLDFSARIAAAREAAHRAAWYAAGTWILALGLWSFQFVGTLSRVPIPLPGLDPLHSIAAAVASVTASYLLLRLANLKPMTRQRWLAGSIGLGLLLTLLHLFTAGSLDLPGVAHYQPLVWLAWCGLATLGAACGLAIVHLFQSRQLAHLLLLRAVTAVGMGLLISLLLHAAIALSPGFGSPVGVVVDTSSLFWLGGVVSLVALTSMGAALVVSELVSQLHGRAQKLSGSVDHLNDQLQHLTNHDPLTGLPNRHMLAQRLAHALVDAREGGGCAAVLYIDLDGFKTINDTLGHSFGDELLRAVATRLAGELRLNSLARMGGDEFAVVLDRMRDPQLAVRIAERLLAAMREPFMVHGTALGVTPSIGIAHYPRDGQTVDALIAHADAAMYDAKERGRNGYRCYDAAMQERALRVLQIQRGLQVAIEDGSLSLHFQPKHDGRTGAMVGAEALIRWRHPELGQVSPLEFIGVAERSGQIGRIGEWVIQETCRQLCEWQAKGLPLVPIAINLSPVQIGQSDLVDVAAGIVAAAGLQPRYIMFEVTESMAMHDAERTTAILREFRARGFEFAIDDFGTGYSSLAYLQKFQVRQLKIDQFFIRALGEGGHEPRAIIAAIIELAHTLGMEVVAEGVETAEQADTLRSLCCDQVQGYYLARPMPARDFEQRCLRGNRTQVA